MITVSLYNKTS